MLPHPLVKSLRVKLVIALSVLVTFSVESRATTSDCPGADAEALLWIDKMSRSLRQTSYQAVVTLQRGNDVQVMHVSHSVGQGSSKERLTELTGQGAQVERDAHALDCVHPGYRMLRIESLAESGRCGIAEQYRFSLMEGERVAGRNAVRIRIEPRDMHRYGYVMALDSDTGLLLKSQTVGHGKETLETMQFAHLTYTESVPPVGQVAVVHRAEHPHPEGAHSNNAVSRAWQVGWLPRGFAPTDAPEGIDGRRTYTDGLAVFSIFLENLHGKFRPGEGSVRHGGTTTYTRGLLLTGQPVLVTVIGEVPVNTARLVASSVNWTQ